MQQTKVEQATVKELQKKRFQLNPGKTLVYVSLSLWAMTTIFPLLWVLNNSLKSSLSITKNSFSLALDPVWTNYVNAFELINIGRSYVNSLIMSGGAVFFTIMFGGMAAYILARFQFKLRTFVQSVLVMSLLIPPFATVVPVYEILMQLDLLNTPWGLILPHTAGFLPFTILVVSSYMSTIPKELEEAAFMDGCNRLKIYTKIFMPMSKPSFATCSIFVFLWSYNDLFSSLIFVGQDHIRPIVVLLSFVSTQYGTDYGLMATAVTLTVFPVLIVYLLIQKYIEKGVTEGAIKG